MTRKPARWTGSFSVPPGSVSSPCRHIIRPAFGRASLRVKQERDSRAKVEQSQAMKGTRMQGLFNRYRHSFPVLFSRIIISNVNL